MGAVGEIRLFGGNYAPEGLAICDGSTLPIAENRDLFGRIGAAYGGDGASVFRLPDLDEAVPVHRGTDFPYGLARGTAMLNVAVKPNRLTYIMALTAPSDDPYLGEIRAFAFEHVPRGWSPCDGRRLRVVSSIALYAVLTERAANTMPTAFTSISPFPICTGTSYPSRRGPDVRSGMW